MDLRDQIIVGKTEHRTVALVVDEVSAVVERPEKEVITAQEILPELEYVQGVVRLQDGMILIHNLDKFLSLEEEAVLGRALVETQTLG